MAMLSGSTPCIHTHNKNLPVDAGRFFLSKILVVLMVALAHAAFELSESGDDHDDRPKYRNGSRVKNVESLQQEN
jgi:hypothetical protein